MRFHERFNVEVGVAEARRRFINRVSNLIFDRFVGTHFTISTSELIIQVADALGERHPDFVFRSTLDQRQQFDELVQSDFYRCLQALEALYRAYLDTGDEEELSLKIERLVNRSEVDLGINWQPPHFIPTGAKLLDERLVNDPLDWISEPRYQAIYEPFAKGLSHFLESAQKPQLLTDVITDMYEALEATAKLIVGNDKDLSANRQRFVDRLPVTEQYKSILKEYSKYANDYRHGANEKQPRAEPARAEVESFVYLTGLFVRLALESTSDLE